MNPNFNKMEDLMLHVWLTTSLPLNISSSKHWLYEGICEKNGKEIREVITYMLKLVTVIIDNFCKLIF